VACAGLGRSRGFQLPKLPVDRARGSRAPVHHRDHLLALGFIALAVGQDGLILVGRSDRTPSPLAGIYRDRRRALCGLNAILQIVVSGSGAAEIANAANAAALALIVAAICFAMMQVTAADLFAAAGSVSVPVSARGAIIPDSNAADRKLVDTLMRLRADERIYRHDNVTIGTLATKLGNTGIQLRRADQPAARLPQFPCLLNNHRIEEARPALPIPRRPKCPSCTIAMDGRFQSLGPFNRAFKATTGGDAERISPASRATAGLTSKYLPLRMNFRIGEAR